MNAADEYGKRTLSLERIDDDTILQFVIHDYIIRNEVIMFTDFMDDNKLHIYPWHQVRHLTIKNPVGG
jgi:hypothetical protein